MAMMLSLYFTLGIFLLLAARDPSANRSLIAFTAWSSFAHAAVMLKRRADVKFLQRLLRELCPHRFTWPRLSGNGQQHYQICLICGTAYEYDWKRMHRTDRLLVTTGHHLLAFGTHPLSQTKVTGT